MAKAGDHGTAGACVQDLPSIRGEEPDAVTPLDVWVGMIQESRKDGGLFSADGSRHFVTRMVTRATFSRYASSKRSALARALVARRRVSSSNAPGSTPSPPTSCRPEEHTSELQSQSNLVCRLLLETKNQQ